MNGAEGQGERESHLLNVIISLHEQELKCDLNRNMKRNISEYNEIDSRLNNQLTEHHESLKRIPEVYSTVLGNIKTAQNKIVSCKEKIDRCKTSLQCQREDLKNLYLDSVKTGRKLELLEKIDRVREVSGQYDSYIKSKHYMHATELLKKNVALLEGTLANVDALKEIKEDLKQRKETLHEELLQQLSNHLYLKAPAAREKVQLFRSGEPPELNDEDVYEDEVEDLSCDPEEDSYRFLKLLVQSLQQLGKLDTTIEYIRMNMESEMQSILMNTAQDLMFKKRQTNRMESDSPSLFPELLAEVFAKYRAVAASHLVVNNAIDHLSCNTQEGKQEDVWSSIQHCVETLLDDYLAMRSEDHSLAVNPSPVTFVPLTNSIGHFFKRNGRRPEKVRSNLFSFESSAMGMTISSEHRAQNFNDTASDSNTCELPPLCIKSPHNITLVFKQINNFIREISNVLSFTETGCLTLQAFLDDFVETTFLKRLNEKITLEIQEINEGNSGLNMVKFTKSGWPRALAEGAVKVQEKLAELRLLMNRMPKYCSKFLDMVYEVLKNYRKICFNMFNNMTGALIQDTLCQVWFKDTSITDIVRKQPSWMAMFPPGGEPCTPTSTNTTTGPSLRDFVTAVGTHQGKEVLDKNRVMIENERLIQLSQLQDSITWLVLYVSNFIEDLQNDKELSDQLPPKLMEDCRIRLGERMGELTSLTHDCMMVLYLEIRVHCYFHLLQVLRKQDYKIESENSDPDTGVTLLNKFFYEMEEKIKDYLPSTHTKFLFEGLGYVMSAIIIDNACNITEMNGAGIKKMSRNILALQQNLTNITLTCELELERARFYYELLYLKPEEILRGIVEQEKRFTKREYTELLNLYFRPHKSKKSAKELERYKKQLDEIVNLQ